MLDKHCGNCFFKEIKDASTSMCWDCKLNPAGGRESGYSAVRWVTESEEFWKDKPVKMTNKVEGNVDWLGVPKSVEPDWPAPSALEVQVGGGHYKDCKIQPIEFIHANKLGFCEGNVVKYITRWRDKGGKTDLEKVIHYVQLLIDLEFDCNGVPHEATDF